MVQQASLVAQPYAYIADTKGRPLDSGKVYFGQPNKDPELYPIDIYYDEGMTLPAPQPTRTKSGYMVSGGDMVEVYSAETEYSIKVLDAYGQQIFYKPSEKKLRPDVVTYSDLQSAINRYFLPIGSTVKTISYHSGWAAQATPPKGGNTYIKVLGGTGVADGGAYIDCPDGTQLKGLFPDGTLSISQYGAKSDGVTNDITAINNAIRNPLGLVPTVPIGVTCISDTIKLGLRGKTLQGVSDVMFRYVVGYNSCEIRWIGGIEPRKTMVLLGQNEVGAEPTIDSTANAISNIYLNGMFKVGFLMYGTYLTNESLVSRVGGEGSTEYNFYFAKSWYCTINGLYSKQCKNNGIALGMPLIYADGTKVTWTTPAPLEMNNSKVTDIRSTGAGQNFSVDNKNTFNPETHAYQGYGIGAGTGNGFRLSHFLSEGSGGINLVSYNSSYPSKTVRDGYLEAGCKNSGLDPATTMVNIYLDYREAASGANDHQYRDIFCNYNSGGILVDRGESTATVTLTSIHQPRFISAPNVTQSQIWKPNHPFNWVSRKDCYYALGYADMLSGNVVLKEQLNVETRYTWSIDMPPTFNYVTVWMRSNAESWTPSGVVKVDNVNGSTYNRSYPPAEEIKKGEWYPLVNVSPSTIKVGFGGVGAAVSSVLDFRITESPLVSKP